MKHQTLCQSLFNPTRSITISPILRTSYASLSSSLAPLSSSTSSANCETQKFDTETKSTALTQQELTKINLLIPRLCLSNHLTTAIHLTTTAFLTNPPLKSLSLSILVHSLTSQPDMSKSMSLLTILRRTPQAHSHLSPIITNLITSYMRKKRPKEALKVYHWSLGPGCPCKVEKTAFLVLVRGFCECGLVLEALKVLREMMSVGFVPCDKLRERVYRSLLREARVGDALKLNGALCGCFGGGGDGGSVKKVVDLLNSMIENWTE